MSNKSDKVDISDKFLFKFTSDLKIWITLLLFLAIAHEYNSFKLFEVDDFLPFCTFWDKISNGISSGFVLVISTVIYILYLVIRYKKLSDSLSGKLILLLITLFLFSSTIPFEIFSSEIKTAKFIRVCSNKILIKNNRTQELKIRSLEEFYGKTLKDISDILDKTS